MLAGKKWKFSTEQPQFVFNFLGFDLVNDSSNLYLFWNVILNSETAQLLNCISSQKNSFLGRIDANHT